LSSSLNVSDEMRVRMPLKMLIALLSIVAVGAIAWAATRGDVAATRVEVSAHGLRIEKLENDARSTREILYRIDERTAEMKRQMDRAGR
jgi:hypothetical protein